MAKNTKNMKKHLTILSLLIVALVFTSCKKESLQSYLVESQEKQGFITVDIPSSILQLKTDDVSDDVKTTLKSIRKINIVALPIKGNEEAYEVEKTKISKILKDAKNYKSLMRMSAKGMKVRLYYTGSEDAIDEVIAFGYGEAAGVGIARILGDNMNPAKIIEMMQNIKLDGDNVGLKQFSAIFSELKGKKTSSIKTDTIN